MTVTKVTDRHKITVGDFDTGQGIRIHIDKTDVTDELLPLFPPQHSRRGRVPYGKDRMATEVKLRVQNGDIKVFNDGSCKLSVKKETESNNGGIISKLKEIINNDRQRNW
jgi:hypothetical protein